MTPQRRTVVVEGDAAEILADIAGLIGHTGAHTLEYAYDRVGQPLDDGEEPGPEDRVRWTATATYKRRRKIPQREIVGEHIVEPGQNHARGGILAAIDLLERMGTNVVVVDMSTEAGGDS